MPSPYATILRTPGAAAFCAAAFVGRIPLSTAGLGIVLLVSAETGSYSLAGALSAAYIVANACASIPLGRLTDRWGQRRVLVPAALTFSVGLSCLVMAVLAGWPIWVAFASALVAGIAVPPTGSCVRARWAYVLFRRPSSKRDETTAQRHLQAAFSFEAAIDELVFVTGPVVATFLAVSVVTSGGVAFALVAGLVGALWLGSLKSTEPPLTSVDDDAGTAPMPWAIVLTVGALSVGSGAMFGSLEVNGVAFAEELGNKSAAGILLAVYALGSLTAGLLYGMVNWQVSLVTRVRVGAVVLVLSMAPTYFVHSFVWMGLMLLIAGCAVAPTLIASISIIERSVPSQRLTEGMTVLHTGVAAGIAPGAAIAGIVIDHHGANAAFLVSAAYGLVTVAIAMAMPDRGLGRGPASSVIVVP